MIHYFKHIFIPCALIYRPGFRPMNKPLAGSPFTKQEIPQEARYLKFSQICPLSLLFLLGDVTSRSSVCLASDIPTCGFTLIKVYKLTTIQDLKTLEIWRQVHFKFNAQLSIKSLNKIPHQDV